MPPSPLLKPGTHVEDWTVVRALHGLGTRTAYEVTRAGQQGRLKFFVAAAPGEPLEASQARLEVELSCLRAVSDPGVVRPLAHGTWMGTRTSPSCAYLVTGFVPGRSLYEWSRLRTTTFASMRTMMMHMTNLVASLNRQRVSLPGLTLQDILLRSGDDLPVLVDLECARLHPEGLDAAERCHDVLMLGHVFYEVVTGQKPRGTPPPSVRSLNPKTPQALNDFLMKLLLPAPSDSDTVN